MLKRTAAVVLAVTFLSLAIAPETLAQRRGRSGCDRVSSSYRSSGFSRVAGTRYYSQPYYGNSYSQPYYGNSYSQPYYGNRYDNGRYYRGRSNSAGNIALTVGAPAAIGAGVGAIVGGGKGAGIGALLGGGGGALYYLINNRGRRR